MVDPVGMSETLRRSNCLTAESYWIPNHIVNSAWLTHGAFASWLIASLEPKTVVELGTHNGFSYFAFCEAAQRLGLPTKCFALDTWEGDDQAGFYDEQVYRSVSEVSTANYPTSSTLLRGYFDESLAMFENESIDLLHIDGQHTYEDVKHDFLSWRPKLSNRAVVLFHDVAERENDFGVWRLWEELAPGQASFSFEHGHGLGVLGFGEEFPVGLKNLFEADETLSEQIRDAYRSLGGRIYGIYALLADQDQLTKGLSAAEGSVESLQHDLAVTRGELDDIATSQAWRIATKLRSVGSHLPGRVRRAFGRMIH